MEIIKKHRMGNRGFTLIELLTVVVVMAILMGLAVGVSKGAMESSKRSQASAEIATYSTALERFKTDNGFIPNATYIDASGGEYKADPTDSAYKMSAAVLFLALTGRQVYIERGDISEQDKESYGKKYIDLKGSQVFTNGTSHDVSVKSWRADTYIGSSVTITDEKGALKDPWGYAYGYYYKSTAENPDDYSLHNGMSFDLWSTAGNKAFKSGITEKWVSNWQK